MGERIDRIDRGRYWSSRASRVRLRINLAVWLGRFVPSFAVLALLAAIGILLLRRTGADERLVWLALAVGAPAVGGLSFWLCRGAFFTQAEALVHLDVVNAFHNRLTSASAGVGDWPAPRARAADGLVWRWPRIVLPVVFAALLLGMAERVPISPSQSARATTLEQPSAWRQIESMLETLKKESIADEAAVASWEERLEELRRSSKDAWYSHSSLEAGDSLRDELRDGLRALESDLDRASEALTGMSARDQRRDILERLARQFEGALSGLEMGTLPLKSELLQDLKGLDLKSLRRLSPQEVEDLRRRLAQGVTMCKLGLGEGEGEGDENTLLLMSLAGAGSGGVDRGPGVAPMWLDPEKTDLHSTHLEPVSNDSMSRAALGEVVGVGRGEHRVDTGAYRGPVAAGSLGSVGGGGEAVWKAPLMPADQNVLRRYFK